MGESGKGRHQPIFSRPSMYGRSAAGMVIEAFGSFVMSGNFVIGIIVFAILVLVNFVVVLCQENAVRLGRVGSSSASSGAVTPSSCDGARRLAEKITGTDGMILSSPEYNWGPPATIKNAVDWMSRMDPMPLRHRSILLCSAAPSPVGGVRGLLHLRDSFETLSTFAYPRLFCVPKADEAFAGDGNLVDETLAREFGEIVADYLKFAVAVANR